MSLCSERSCEPFGYFFAFTLLSPSLNKKRRHWLPEKETTPIHSKKSTEIRKKPMVSFFLLFHYTVFTLKSSKSPTIILKTLGKVKAPSKWKSEILKDSLVYLILSNEKKHKSKHLLKQFSHGVISHGVNWLFFLFDLIEESVSNDDSITKNKNKV